MDEKEKLAAWIKTGNDVADPKIDSFLDKVKSSKRTAAILVGGVMGLCFLAWLMG